MKKSCPKGSSEFKSVFAVVFPRLPAEDWGIVSGETCDEVERAIRKLQ